MNIYIYIYIPMYIHMYMCICIYICACTFSAVSMYIYVYLYKDLEVVPHPQNILPVHVPSGTSGPGSGPIYAHSGCARLNVTTHRWHRRVCFAELNDISAYTTARLSDIRAGTRYLAPSPWYPVPGSTKDMVPRTWYKYLLLGTEAYAELNDIRVSRATNSMK